MLRAVWDAGASLFLGAVCPGCGVPSASLCAACRSVLQAPRPTLVRGPTGSPAWAAAVYDGVWREALVAFKERQAWALAHPLGGALGRAVAAAVFGEASGPLLLVPMPSLPRAVRERGEDTTLLLARRAARALRAAGADARVEACLRHRRRVSDQAGLSAAGRRANLAGALVARPRGEGVRVVVDDLTTTGASLAEAARALARAGTPPAAAAVVAATPRRGRTRPPTHRDNSA